MKRDDTEMQEITWAEYSRMMKKKDCCKAEKTKQQDNHMKRVRNTDDSGDEGRTGCGGDTGDGDETQLKHASCNVVICEL